MTTASLQGLVIDTVEFPVEAGKVREFARAVGDPDESGVPLTFIVVALHWRDQGALVSLLGLRLAKVVVGGCEWEHHAPVRVGDCLRGTRVVTAVERRERPEGTMTVITLESRFCNQHGEVAAVQRDTIIEVP